MPDEFTDTTEHKPESKPLSSPAEEINALPSIDQRYETGLSQIAKEFSDQDRAKELTIVAAQSLKHFFDKEVYGDPELNGIDKLPTYWSYVRFLTWDKLRPHLGHGETEYANHNYSDKFLQDISDEANQISELMPENLKPEEWHFMVRVWSHMLMSDPFLVRQGYITEEGRDHMITHALYAGPSDEMYHSRFSQWRDNLSTGIRES